LDVEVGRRFGFGEGRCAGKRQAAGDLIALFKCGILPRVRGCQLGMAIKPIRVQGIPAPERLTLGAKSHVDARAGARDRVGFSEGSVEHVVVVELRDAE
jgi:hypothetical protein